MSHLEKTVDTKVNDLEKTVDGKLVMMEANISNLQSQRPELSISIQVPIRETAETDGTILALKGAAAEILKTMPVVCRNNYNELMVALQRKFSHEH